MKTIFQIITCLLLAQTVLKSQTLNHPTVEKVQVTYKMLPISAPSTTVTSPTPEIKVRLEAQVLLKTTTGISKIYLKMLNQPENTVNYTVNYNLSAANNITPQGVKLFVKDNNTIYISNPDAVNLKPYVYEIQTEDTQGTLSPVFSIIQ